MSSTPTDQNPFAPPTARVEDVATSGPELAGRGARLGGAFIDGLIHIGVYWLLALTLLKPMLPNLARGANAGLGVTLSTMVVSIVLFLLIQGYLLATAGQTIGKKLL